MDDINPCSDRTYYSELDVREDASSSRIRAAFRKCALKYHPDRNPNDGAAEGNFKRINGAYRVLSDPTKREAYDRTLKAIREAAEADRAARRAERRRAASDAEAAARPPGVGTRPAEHPSAASAAGGSGRASPGLQWPRGLDAWAEFAVSWGYLIFMLLVPILLFAWVSLAIGVGLVGWAVYRRVKSTRLRLTDPSRKPENWWLTAAIVSAAVLLLLRAGLELVQRHHEPHTAQSQIGGQRAVSALVERFVHRIEAAKKVADLGDVRQARALLNGMVSEITDLDTRLGQPRLIVLVIIMGDLEDLKQDLDARVQRQILGSAKLIDTEIASGKVLAQQHEWLAADDQFRSAAKRLEEIEKLPDADRASAPRGLALSHKKEEVVLMRSAIAGSVAVEQERRDHESLYARMCGPSPDVSKEGSDMLALRTLIQRRAHDSDSIEVSDCTMPVLANCWVFRCKVQGRNALGAKVLQTQTFQRTASGFHEFFGKHGSGSPAPAPPR